MLKKIVLGALLTGLVAVLILGAVNRTNAVNGNGAGGSGRHGQTTESLLADAVRSGSGVQNNGGRWAQEGATNEANRQGGGRWGQGAAAERAGQGSTLDGFPQADVQPNDWRTVEGRVVSAAADLVEIVTTDGQVIPFEGRPLSYALEQGFSVQEGDAVTLSGFDEDGEFKIGQVTSNGVTVTLRDVNGRPGWAGRGRR